MVHKGDDLQAKHNCFAIIVFVESGFASSGNWIHSSTLFRNGPKRRTAQRNKKRTTLLGIFCTSLKVETRFTFKSTKKPLDFSRGFLCR